jgi:peptide methionine sulfoxide reductase msrA/msrB
VHVMKMMKRIGQNEARLIVAAVVSTIVIVAIVGPPVITAGPNPADGNSDDRPRAAKDRIMKPNSEWKSCLTPEQYQVLRQQGTEGAFTGKYYNHHGVGIYACAGCGQELFRSAEKYDSGTGWPSFWKAADSSAVKFKKDSSHGMQRTEVLCARCGGHLGHVFEDGPGPSGMHYCINSAALEFEKEPAAKTDLVTATFGAGCFWCTEAAFNTIPGVQSVRVGYMGGRTANPTYNEVCSGKTGHAEVTRVTYDPQQVSYGRLLDVFWQVHDPTSLNRQGADVGTQYRSVIFYNNDEQKKTAEKAKARLTAEGKYNRPIVTGIVAASEFYEAEDYHQDYYQNNPDAPYCRMVIAPKLKKLK